jgi:hypothetical protein
MQMTAIDLAWIKGESSYAKDSLLDGAIKAEAEGYRPQSEAFTAFLYGFSRMLRGEHVG